MAQTLLRSLLESEHRDGCAKSQLIRRDALCTPVSEIRFAVLARRSRNAYERRMHAVIFSYFDDSGDDKREAHVAVGGIIGHEIWINLCEGNWIKETKNLKEPFRSIDCECQHGQFAD